MRRNRNQGDGEADGHVVGLLDEENRELPAAEEGQEVRLFLDVSPFYAEGGGQIGDQGLIRTETGIVRVERSSSRYRIAGAR